MSVPRRKSLLAFLAFFGVVAGMAVAYFTLPSVVVAALLAVALIAAPVALGMGFVYAGEARSLIRMERGEGILARWTISATHWRDFQQLNETLDSQKPWSKARQVFTGEAPASGVEIVFMEDAVFIGGRICWLVRTLSPVVALHDSWIEFELTTSGEPEIITLRIPIAPEAQSEAARVVNHFNATRNPPQCIVS